MRFNETFNDKGEKSPFIYRRNPLVERSFQLFGFDDEKNAYEPVGEYICLDLNEDTDITEKKVINVVSLMNGKKNLIDFKKLTKERVLFTIVPETPDSGFKKIVFRTYDGQGVSRENAVLTIEKGVFHETNS